MKVPKEISRYCPSCKKHTVHKVKLEKNRGKNKTHPMTQFSKVRQELRGIGIGKGNKGRMSRGSLNSWKRYNKKMTKRPDFRYTCSECKKIHTSGSKAKRAKKIIIE